MTTAPQALLLLNGDFTGINASTAVNPAIECTDSVGGYDVQDFLANAAISRRLAPKRRRRG